MAITYSEKQKIFQLDTNNTSYLIGIVDKEQFVGHIYYGKKIRPSDCETTADTAYLMRTEENPFVPSKNERDRVVFSDQFFFEYPGHGLGDYRESTLSVETAEGYSAVFVTYESYEIIEEKPKLPGLPATFKNDGKTLILHCKDTACNLRVDLIYSVFEKADVITRSVVVHNDGVKPLYLTKVFSACLDMDDKNFEAITLHGSWARERHIDIRKIGYGKLSAGSVRGETSHQEHPFMALKAEGATEDSGDVYGFNLVYSGNFLTQIEKTQMDAIRAVIGIHPEGFKWKLEPQEKFYSPEAVLTFSANGLGQMTRNFHDLYREHLIRSPYKFEKRPILINNWEATYFDFDTDKLLSIAKRASELGIEMLVMDDGWFGKRNDDNTSLGDWKVNEEKIKGGLKFLVDEVNKLGMKFGIWFEPEMVSPDSDLYRTHPDWAIQTSTRKPSLCRNQFVLDITRKEVRDYVYESVAAILRSANIEYVKWDMNRQLTDLGSIALPADRMGELYHRYVLGVYELQERLVTDFPKLLLENCSGGGARFDAGMLYYSPQIWCSDDTDAIERLKIQEGTAIAYPLSAIGAHVSDCPNHSVGRVTPFETRGFVALAGTFGYELDITKISEQDQNMIKEQVALYHKYGDLVRKGDYYRIASYSENREYDCYMMVSKDKKEALVTFVQVLNRPNYRSRIIRLKGLDPSFDYVLDGDDKKRYGGDLLMNAGLIIEKMWGDFKGKLIHLRACV